jgi:hypothetical protein
MRPAMSPLETKRYCKLLECAKIVLEFGSGGSTILAAEQPNLQITSVDTDVSWFDRLREFAPVRAAEREGRLRFVAIDVGPTKEWGYPTDQRAIERWPMYSTAPWSSVQTAPDLILIDGRFRVACALEAARRRTLNGATIAIHDFQRRHYQIARLFLKRIEMVERLAIFRRRTVISSFLVDLALKAYRYDPK